MAILIKDKKLLFVHIPKTGGESISNWLKNYFDAKDVGWKHSDINDINISYYTHSFAVVRHPYDRLTSWYNHLVRELNIKGSKRNRETRQLIKLCEEEDGINSYIEYCLNDTSPHYLIWKPQHLFVNSSTEIFKFETLDNDFQTLQNKLNCFEDLPYDNVSSSSTSILSTKNKKLLRKIYQKDFLKFKYEEEI